MAFAERIETNPRPNSRGQVRGVQIRDIFPTSIKEKSRVDEIPCPCCRQIVPAPTLDIVIDHYGLTPVEACILGAIWKGKGMPVMSERIFDAIYIDDPDGGPEPSRMYVALKVGLCHIRAKIRGSGVWIETVGYRQGFRLVFNDGGYTNAKGKG